MTHNSPMPPIIQVSEAIDLRISAADQAEGLFQAIENNRAYLGEFLPWVPYMNTLSDSVTYLTQSQANCIAGTELSYNIYKNDILIGRIGIHQIDRSNNNAAIGYWISEDAQGKGVITACCTALINIGFQQLELQRLEILTATHNVKSSAIPMRLGFVHEGIMRQVERHGDQYFDLNIFSMLRKEWTEEHQQTF